MKVSSARSAAFEVLLRIEAERAFSSVLLPAYEEDLAANDRALTHELVLGVLRKQIYLDRVIDLFTRGKRLDAEVRIALRLGAYQLLFLTKIPAYSAINESVNLVHRVKKSSAKGLVNAILRRISEKQFTIEHEDETDRVVVETSHPRWLIERWTEQFGRSEAEELAKSNNTIPPPAFRLTAKNTRPQLPGDHRESEWLRGCYIASSLTPELRNMMETGEIYFQDEASQLVAAAVVERAGRRIMDVCAAPGGKTTQIAKDLADVFIVAGDRHAARVRLLRSTCERQGVGYVNVLQYDADDAIPFADDSFDTVLVDAPCTGTGTIRHNPEIRYFLDPTDVGQLSNKQLAILSNASKVVKPGGRLIYSTCSLQIEENEAVCEQFQRSVQGFRQVRPAVPSRFLTDRGFARTFPHRDGMDGFFIAEFERLAL